jgi:hypothetical protein
VQNTATIIRVSESNGRLQSVQPWLDVMSGGPTTPLGTVTLLDAINPGRFLRFDLNTMTDQGAYWDLGVTFIEGSDASPFTDDEAVTIGFIAGVSAAGSTVPVGSLSPVARDTFLGNIGTTTAPPAAVPFASIDSTSIIYDATAHEMQRAALTGAISASANANATVFAGILQNASSTNDRTNLNFADSTSVSAAVTDNPGNDRIDIAFQRAALTGDVTASANTNATTIANNAVTNAKAADMAANTIKANPTAGTADPQDLAISVDNFPARLAGNIITHPFATLAGGSLSYTAGSGKLVYIGNATGNDLGAISGAQGVVSLTGVECGGCVTTNGATADYTIAGFTAAANDGFWFDFVDRSTTGSVKGKFLEAALAAATDMRLPGGADLVFSRGSAFRFSYQNSRWRCASLPGSGRLVKVTHYTGSAPGTGTHTFDALCSSYLLEYRGAQGGGGGANSAAAECAVGGQGGFGFEGAIYVTTVPASVTYTVGTGGSGGASTGADGAAGGNSSWDSITLIAQGDGGRGSANATLGSGSGTTLGITMGGKGGQTITGSLPTGGAVIRANTGKPGGMGVRMSGTAGWGGGYDTGVVSVLGGGGRSVNNSDIAGHDGEDARFTVYEFS